MKTMTREAVCAVIRREAWNAGGLRAYARRHGVSTSTLSNMLHGRNRFTPRVLGLLGLGPVQIVESTAGRPDVPVAHPVRRSRPMWRLGDWPRFR